MIIHALFLNNFLGLRDMLLLLIPMILLQLCERMPNPMGESAVDCESVPSMPTVAFTIGGKEFELAPEEVLYLNSSLTIDAAPPLFIGLVAMHKLVKCNQLIILIMRCQ